MYGFFIDYFLGNIPTWVWPFVAGGSIVIYFLAHVLSALPQVKPYAIFVKPVAFISFTLGVFMYGGSGVVAVYQERVKEAEQKAELADQQSKSASDQLNSYIKERRDDLHQNRDAARTKIAANAQQLNKECTVSTEAIGIHNDAAQNKKTSVTVTLDGKVTTK